MVDKTINDFTEDTSPETTDYLLSWDGSANATKKVSIANALASGVSGAVVTSGSGAPGTTPSAVGNIYIDTTADEAYIATDTNSSADWDLLVTETATDISGAGWYIDEDNMSSDDATKVPSQQSVKAYADTKLANVVEDTTPQLGGNLDPNGNNVGDASAADLTKLSELTATSTELNYVDGVTSAIQDQLDDKAPAELTLNAQSGTTYTLVLADASKYVRLNNAAAITMTVPPNSSVAFPTGTQIVLRQVGAGQVTVAAGAGVTVNTSQTLKLRAQHSTASLIKVGTDEWDLAGDLEAP